MTINWINQGTINSAMTVLYALIISIVGVFVIKLITKGFVKLLTYRKVDGIIISFSQSAIRVTAYIVLLLTVLSQLGIDITPLLTVIGTAGLAVGFALRDSLSNLAGGILILIYRPFKIGDVIEYNGNIGSVSEISLLYTFLNTADNKRVILSNGHLSSGNLVNYSFEATRRVDLMFGVSYHTSVDHVKNVLEAIAADHPLIIQDKEKIIKLAKHNESSIDFVFKVWTATENYWAVYYDIHEQVKQKFDLEGIEIPYKQMEVQILEKFISK